MLAALFSLAALPLAAHAFLDFPTDNRMVQQPGLIRYPISVSQGAESKNRVFRRQNDVGLTPQQTGFFYSIEIQIGTPPQAVSVNFDTGSDQLWVNPVCSKSTDAQFCESFGRFNGSQTFTNLNRTGSIKYGTGFAKLAYGYDYIQIGSAKISQQMFGVATDSQFAVTGIMGAAPNLNGWDSPYPLVIDSLAQQGFTNSRAFSLDIRSIESKRGSVVFGGLDTKKFSGRLEKRPIIPAASSPDGWTRYWIYLDGITVSKGDGSTVQVFDKPNGQPVLVDSGYTVSALPKAIVDEILKAFPDVEMPTGNSTQYKVPCSTGDIKGHVNFKFGQTTINVPYSDFLWRQPQNGICVLGVMPDDEFPVLGDTFLRAAYVVYDWDNRNIHLANNEDCGSNLVAIGKGPDAVPSAEGECGSSTATSAPLSSASATASSSLQPTVTATNSTSGSSAAVESSVASTAGSMTVTNSSIAVTTSSGAVTTSSGAIATTSSGTPTTNSFKSTGTAATNSTSSSAAFTTSSTVTLTSSITNGASSSSEPTMTRTNLTSSSSADATSSKTATATETDSSAPSPTSAATGPSQPITTTENNSTSSAIVATTSSSEPAATAATGSASSSNAATLASSKPAAISTDSTSPVTATTVTTPSKATATHGPVSTPDRNHSVAVKSSVTSSSASLLPSSWRNTTALPTFTSTFTSTKMYTVTSCPPSVTSCPVGAVTTETIIGTTTWCPGQSSSTAAKDTSGPAEVTATTEAPSPSITSIYTTTKTHTMTDCQGKEACRKGHVTTEVLTKTTYLCPESTATWTIPRTSTCIEGDEGCTPGQTIVTTDTVTIVPITTGPKPTPVPGCSGCNMPPLVPTTPAKTTPAATSPAQPSAARTQPPAQSPPAQTQPPAQTPTPVKTAPGTISTVPRPASAAACTTCGPKSSATAPATVTAAAAQWRAPGAAALALGALAVAGL